ncbi:hypothetical protein BKA69DRAFT_819845 [Paraphysoderma sedebokerense]|nr:hypothetical protein BKA69DRAFT_819845 [Paraphysoderma sedebokerense]
MTSDDSLHLFSYSAAGGSAETIAFVGKVGVASSVQQSLGTGLSWRTTSAFTLQYNRFNNDLYAIKYTTYTWWGELQISVLDSYGTYKSAISYGGVVLFDDYWRTIFKNPRFSTFVDASFLYVGILNDPSVTGTTGSIGFWLSKSTYSSGSVSASSRTFNTTQKVLAIEFQCNMNPSIICIWTSQNSVDEYSITSLSYLRSRSTNGTPMKFNPSVAKNSSERMSYYFHRSVDTAGNPFVLYRRDENLQQVSSMSLPYQISFSDAIPEFGVRVGSSTNAVVGFTTTLNSSIAYGDSEIVVCEHNSNTLELQGQMIVSTIGKENFAAIIPQTNGGLIIIGRSNGQLNSPNAAPGSTHVFVMQFGPLKVVSFQSTRPMQVSPDEVVLVQFESVPSSLAAIIPSVRYNGLACTSVSWISPNILSLQIPGNIQGVGPYDLWISFDSVLYKPSVRIPGILALQLQLFSVYPNNGSTVGYDITLITSDMGVVQDPISVTVGGIACGSPSQLNDTAFRCTVPPGLKI